jgi:aspartate 1-decarboxylase
MGGGCEVGALAAARLPPMQIHVLKPGDLLTIMSYALVEEVDGRGWEPQVIILGAGNRIESERGI